MLSTKRDRTRARTMLSDTLSRRWRDARGEQGNLVIAIILIALLAILITASVSSVIGGAPTATQSQQGAQAVAQAHAGLSNALFRLDQVGGNASSFCVGTPPAGVLPSDLSSASCSPSGTEPLGSAAPGLQYYYVDQVSGTLPLGVTREMKIVSHGVSGGQARTISAVLYEESNSFGAFGVSGLTYNGTLTGANVQAVAGSSGSSGSVTFGGGKFSTLNCNGGAGSVIFVGGSGSSGATCHSTNTGSTFEPAAPTVCSPGQASSAFAPCVDVSAAALNGSNPYCPLPVLTPSGIPNTSYLGGITSTGGPSDNASPSGVNTVFDCSSSSPTSDSVTISTSYLTGSTITKIPEGVYYVNSDNVTFGDIDQAKLAGPVTIFVIPEYCTASSTNCFVNGASRTGSCPSSYKGASNTNTQLALNGNLNVNPSAPNPPPGNPGNLTIYWASKLNSNIVTAKKKWLDGTLYAPLANLDDSGNTGLSVYGQLILNCWKYDGSPTITFAYPFHATQAISGWTVADYRISY